MRHDADNNQANNDQPDSAVVLNPYAAPKAALSHHVEGTPDDYVVAKTKFWVLFVGTFSLYGVYWFYRQWDAQKERNGLNIWPIWRAVFSIFLRYRSPNASTIIYFITTSTTNGNQMLRLRSVSHSP